jgi:hypothetical protein
LSENSPQRWENPTRLWSQASIKCGNFHKNRYGYLQRFSVRWALLTNISNVHHMVFYGQCPVRGACALRSVPACWETPTGEPVACCRESRHSHWSHRLQDFSPPYDLWSNHVKSAVLSPRQTSHRAR